MKSILILTSGQPSLNPRLVKEADCLIEAGFNVTVIYQYRNDWGTILDSELYPQKKWKANRIAGAPSSNKCIYWLSRIMHKLANTLPIKFVFKYLIAEQAISRASLLLIHKARHFKADLYIAHNLGALPAAVLASEKYNAKCGFDAEDFHRHEITNNLKSLDYRRKKYIEDKYIPRLDYLTAASSIISKAYQDLYPKSCPQTILNAFPSENVLLPKVKNKLRLFWFSQTLGKNRGLEKVITALKNIENIELHLLGSCDLSTKKYFVNKELKMQNNAINIIYHEPIPSAEIIKFASQFDIGLAMETGKPFNRDICLTNKIFTYIQAGLAVIASDTTAQTSLMDEYPNMGMIYKKDSAASLSEKIKAYTENKELLIRHQQQAYKYANEVLNWEIEKEKFLSIIKKTFKI